MPNRMGGSQNLNNNNNNNNNCTVNNFVNKSNAGSHITICKDDPQNSNASLEREFCTG
jgi:hypothetical protein